jgi:3-hydroxyisobutyrate dehydrogenase
LRYGLIGLGNLVKHLAASLLRQGFDLAAYDLSRAAARELIERGAKRALEDALHTDLRAPGFPAVLEPGAP